MNEHDVRGRVRAVVLELAPIAPPAPAGNWDLVEDLGYDSLGLIELAVALEQELSLPPLSEHDSLGVTLLDDVEDLVIRVRESGGR
jgi:acyl carrier protein